MDKAQIYVGLDIGTTAIRVIVGESINEHLNIIGVGSEQSQGLKDGVIVDIDKVVAATRKAVHQAQAKANVKFDQVVVGVPAKEMLIEPVKGMAIVADQPKEITDQEVRNVASAALSRNLPPEREIVAITPQQFIVDGQAHIVDPRGMSAVRIEMEALVYSVPTLVVNNIRKVLERTGLRLKHFVLNSLALSTVALNDGEQDFGTILMDMGGAQSTAYVIHDHQLKFIVEDDEGGDNLTKDVSVVLNTSMTSAEKIKRNYGVANPRSTSDSEKFPVEIVGQDDPVLVDETYLSEILEARFEQIFDRLAAKLEQVHAFDLPGGVVITGGVAETMSLNSLAAELLDAKVRIYTPKEMGLRNSSFATVLGLITYAAGLSEIELLVTSVINHNALSATASQPAVQKESESAQTSDSRFGTFGFGNRSNQTPSQQNQAKSPTTAAKKPKQSEPKNKFRNFFNKFFD